MTQYKSMTIRIPIQMAQTLAMIAEADNVTQSDVIRNAIDSWITYRKADPLFQERLRHEIETLKSLLMPN